MKKYIRYIGFSKKYNKKIAITSCAETERADIIRLYEYFEPETIIEVRELTGELLDRCELQVIFNYEKFN